VVRTFEQKLNRWREIASLSHAELARQDLVLL
jgi:hypothetical protein